jgi:hypothetical protein
MKSITRTLVVLLGIVSGCRCATVTVLEPPGGMKFPTARPGQAHEATLVNGRRVTPVGEVIYTQSYNWGMTIDAPGPGWP